MPTRAARSFTSTTSETAIPLVHAGSGIRGGNSASPSVKFHQVPSLTRAKTHTMNPAMYCT